MDFLRMKLDEDQEPDATDERLRADIMEIIPGPVLGRHSYSKYCV